MSAEPPTARSRRELVADLLRTLSPAQEHRLLTEILSLELLAVQLYGLAAAAPSVTPAGQELARQLRAQERAHATELARLAKQPAPTQPDLSPAAAERVLAAHGIDVALDALRSERQWFTLLESLERLLEGVHFQALGRLTNPAHATLLARIMASEAQHSTLLLSFNNPQNIQLDVSEGQIKGRVR